MQSIHSFNTRKIKERIFIVGFIGNKKPTFKRAGVQLDIDGQRVFRIKAKSEFHALHQFRDIYGEDLCDKITITTPR